LGGVNSFIQNFVMDYQTWNLFYLVQQAGDALSDPLVRGVVAVVFVITVIPALVLRFRLNLIAFSDDEGRMMGVRPGLLRGLALVLGSAMQLAAIASIGQIAMLSLVVPILVRYLMPSDFRSQYLGNCLVGTALLLVCILIQHFATLGIITVPVGTIVSIFIVPFFVWVIAFGRGRWG
jgi:iron complex transport system permease protein